MILAYAYLWSGLAAEWLYGKGLWPRRWVNLWRVVVFLLLAVPAMGQTCNPALAKHIYHPKRLVVQEACVTVTGVWVDASHGRTGDGCRHEKDGDGHCFLKLDPGQEKYLNAKNMQNEDGNLVVEPICVYRTTQPDAKPACKGWRQQIALPKIGSHVSITGPWVLDTQHGHFEIHPPSSIEVLK